MRAAVGIRVRRRRWRRLAATAAGGPAAAASCPSNLAGGLDLDRRGGAADHRRGPGYATSTGVAEALAEGRRLLGRGGGPWSVRLGRNGLSDHHVEGDGTTPTGAYGLGPVIYGLAPGPRRPLPLPPARLRRLVGREPALGRATTPSGTSAAAPRPSFAGPGDDGLWLSKRAYQHFVPIRYNTDPAVPGRGSAIFLHDDWGSPTHGCITLAASRLETVLRWLRPAAKPLIVIGTTGELKRS